MTGRMKFCILGSGSGGNACYVETKYTAVLIDAGLSCREIERRLQLMGISPKRLDALIVTHEHSDHIKGAGALVRRRNIPLFINHKTLLTAEGNLGKIEWPVIIQTGQTVTINDIAVETFTKCHDAVDPFGLVLSSNGVRIGMATDLGKITRLVEDRLKGCQALIMEFNYDQKMLDEGPYPLDLKRRIMGQEGHLSNHQACDLLKNVIHGDLEVVVLAHLSRTNNKPEMACKMAEDIIDEYGQKSVPVYVGDQDQPGPLVEI
jgi:phosphoribosyl 1,2-cyclic phosphodiesterase